MTTERITLKTNDDAIAYLDSRNFGTAVFDQVDDKGNRFYTMKVTCKRCGGLGYYPTQRHGACYECGGRPTTYTVKVTALETAKKYRQKELYHLRKGKKDERKAKAFKEKTDKARAEFDVNFPGVFEKLSPFITKTDSYGDIIEGTRHPLLNDLAHKLNVYGSISEKQVALAEKVLAELEAPKAKLEGGRREVTGKVLSCKWRDSSYGGAFKMTVALDDGTRVWGTVPAALEDAARDYYQTHVTTSATFHLDEVLKGATVTFTATINPSDDDPAFGFLKRPTNPVLAGVAWVAPEVGDARCDFCDGRHSTHECPGEAFEAARSDDR